MIKQAPVKLHWQIVFVLLPFMWIYAFYRIEKLRLALLIYIPSNASFILGQWLFSTSTCQYDISPSSLIANRFSWCPFPYYIILQVIGLMLAIIMIYLVIKWTKDWNKRFQTT